MPLPDPQDPVAFMARENPKMVSGEMTRDKPPPVSGGAEASKRP